MYAQLAQCGDSPRVERYGYGVRIVFGDGGHSKIQVDMDPAQAISLSVALLEVAREIEGGVKTNGITG